jgi:hypothetical protein
MIPSPAIIALGAYGAVPSSSEERPPIPDFNPVRLLVALAQLPAATSSYRHVAQHNTELSPHPTHLRDVLHTRPEPCTVDLSAQLRTGGTRSATPSKLYANRRASLALSYQPTMSTPGMPGQASRCTDKHPATCCKPSNQIPSRPSRGCPAASAPSLQKGSAQAGYQRGEHPCTHPRDNREG